ncbi:MAG: hypothetical protein KDC85_09575 [Saprospiraceae bacterium]|nr:hypothetical protein [Saprospiraceae bacterium]MCB9322955.1 hypothetical protein [Lewinellaceae bacterium]
MVKEIDLGKKSHLTGEMSKNIVAQIVHDGSYISPHAIAHVRSRAKSYGGLEYPPYEGVSREEMEEMKASEFSRITREVPRIYNSNLTGIAYEIGNEIANSGELKVAQDDRVKVLMDDKMYKLISETLPKLSDEIYDLGKSIGRGFRDLVRGNSLQTEMKNKIKSEMVEPLREYLKNENINTMKPKEEINSSLDALLEKYFSTSKGRG